ncbi:MAG: hypothetical protein ACK2U9_14455 [Anaerolineae bacterium]
MSFKNLFIKHERSPEEEAWIQEEIEEQEARFARIEQSMDELKPQRAKWYAEFLDRISTIGFNVDGDQKQVIPKENLPVQPAGREDRVVWKYGVDGD